MLTGVEPIDWNQLGFPGMSDLLARLQSQDTKASNEAYGELEWNVIYSGESFQTIDLGYGAKRVFSTEVHYFLIPVLIALLSQAEPHTQRLIMPLLAEAASFAHQLTDAKGIFLERAIHVHQIVWGGFATYLQLVLGSDEDLAVSAGWLLCEYPEHFLQLYPILLSTIKRLSGDDECARLLWRVYKALTERKNIPEDFSQLLLEILENKLRTKSQATAAICLVDHLKKAAPEIAIDLVVKVVVDLDTPTQAYKSLPPGYEIAREILNQL